MKSNHAVSARRDQKQPSEQASQKVRQVGRATLVHKLELEAAPLHYCTEQVPSLDKAFIANLPV